MPSFNANEAFTQFAYMTMSQISASKKEAYLAALSWEDFFAVDPVNSFFFVKHYTYTEPFPEAELYIYKDKETTYRYARDGLKGRVDELTEMNLFLSSNSVEDAASSLRYGYLYCRDVIKERWTSYETFLAMTERRYQEYVDQYSYFYIAYVTFPLLPPIPEEIVFKLSTSLSIEYLTNLIDPSHEKYQDLRIRLEELLYACFRSSLFSIIDNITSYDRLHVFQYKSIAHQIRRYLTEIKKEPWPDYIDILNENVSSYPPLITEIDFYTTFTQNL